MVVLHPTWALREKDRVPLPLPAVARRGVHEIAAGARKEQVSDSLNALSFAVGVIAILTAAAADWDIDGVLLPRHDHVLGCVDTATRKVGRPRYDEPIGFHYAGRPFADDDEIALLRHRTK